MTRIAPLLIAAAVTALILAAVSMTPYFFGDVAIARAVQSLSPGTDWAVAFTNTARAPMKFVLMAVALGLCWSLAGWRAVVLGAAVMLVEQLGGEASKAIAARPRPSPDLVAVVGSPSGFGFPSTFVTLYCVTAGLTGLVAWRSRASVLRTALLVVVPLVMVLAWAARVVPGAHWPSDVVLTTVICLAWIWAILRIGFLPRGTGDV